MHVDLMQDRQSAGEIDAHRLFINNDPSTWRPNAG